jgi:hypothetical protein
VTIDNQGEWCSWSGSALLYMKGVPTGYFRPFGA